MEVVLGMCMETLDHFQTFWPLVITQLMDVLHREEVLL